MATVINPPATPHRIMLIAGNYQVLGVDGILRVGGFEFDPDKWNTTTHRFTLYSVIQVNNAAQGVGCLLYNFTDSDPIGAYMSHTGNTDPTLKSVPLTIGSAAGNLQHGSHIYEAWLSADNVAGVIGTLTQMYIQVEHL